MRDDMTDPADDLTAVAAGAIPPSAALLTAIPLILQRANAEIDGVLRNLRDCRTQLESATSDRLHVTREKLREVTSTTEIAATDILDGLDRAQGMVDALDVVAGSPEPQPGRGPELRQQLRDEIFTITGCLQFQDITSQQLTHASAVLVDMESRLAGIAGLIANWRGDAPDLAEVDTPAREAQATYSTDASYLDAEHRQSIADSIFGGHATAPPPQDRARPDRTDDEEPTRASVVDSGPAAAPAASPTPAEPSPPSAAPMSTPALPTMQAAMAGKYLTFFLDAEEYGIEILKVQEIIGLLPITRVPRTPRFVKGVINLRGKVIPIIDLRGKFGMAAAAGGESCMIVVAVQGVQLGVMVDRVSEVRSIAQGDIVEPPSFGTGVDTGYLLGIARSAGRVTLLLDIDHVLTTAEVLDIRASALEDAA
jgi:purine-binding chemotaxis protein CheW